MLISARSIAILGILGLLSGGLALATNEEPREAGETIELPRRLEGVTGPLDWVFERVETGSDPFVSEEVHDRIATAIERWLTYVREDRSESFVGPLPPEEPLPPDDPLRAFLAASFSAEHPAPSPLERRYDRGGLVVERARFRAAGRPGSDPVRVGARSLHRALRTQFAWLGTPRDTRRKIVRVRVGRDDRSATVRILCEADGIVSSALGTAPGRRQFRAIWDLDWIREPVGWRLARLKPIAFERAAWRSPPFADVTRPAFGEIPAFRDQLALGTDAWRARLDSATGIDIYGHQGVSVGDYDGDGWEDLYVAQPAGLPNRLLRNRGDGSFEDRTRGSGLDVLDVTGGSLWIELDEDGDEDLVVATGLAVLVFENRGRGTFRHRADALAGASSDGASAMGCAASDYDGDGDLDLYVYSYLFWAGAGAKSQSTYPYPYHDANNGAPNALFRNDGGFRFTDVTRAAGMERANRRFSFAASWCDYDEDGDPDLYVANDFGSNNLYRNRGDGRFDEVARESGVLDTGNGMSVTWEDVDGDGRFDLYVGNMWSSAGARLSEQARFRESSGDLQSLYRRMSRGNSLFRNRGDGGFDDITTQSGAAFGRWSWSAQFLDHDGDGRRELYVANGFVTNTEKRDL